MKKKIITVVIVSLILISMIGGVIFSQVVLNNGSDEGDDDTSMIDPISFDRIGPSGPFLFTDAMMDAYLVNHSYPVDGPYSEFETDGLFRYDHYSLVIERFGHSALTDDMLEENGFVVAEGNRETSFRNFNQAYAYYFNNDLPIMVTTDTILNVFHLMFEDMLKCYETTVLGPSIEFMLEELFEDAWDQLSTYSTIEDSYQREILVYLAVGRSLIQEDFDVPDSIKGEVDAYQKKIVAAVAVEDHPGQDYTQYKPRGHYTETEYLKSYFRTMMWVQRSLRDLEENDGLSFSWAVSHLLQSNDEARTSWEKVYLFTKYLIGSSDCITPRDLVKASTKLFGSSSLDQINDENLDKMIIELGGEEYHRSRILSFVILDIFYDESTFPKQWSLMGQRYVLDADIIDNVIYDRIPSDRLLGSSLDVMAALGSTRAYEHLANERQVHGYSHELQREWANAQMMPADFWNQSVYNGVLDSYREVLQPLENPPQDFMGTGEWADLKLNTALGSYAELKHDTVLYAKQAYSNTMCEFPEVYVEPAPSMYDRIATVCDGLTSILHDEPMGDIPEEWGRVFDSTHEDVFKTLSSICKKLSEISEDEMNGKDLTKEQVDFIRGIYTGDVNCMSGHAQELRGWLVELFAMVDLEDIVFDSALVTDICTAPDGMTMKVRQIGTGRVETLIVLIEKPDGQKFCAVGPVYSFYEFDQPMTDRLTDEQWREMTDVERPEWTSSFHS